MQERIITSMNQIQSTTFISHQEYDF